jgi:cathepsin X
MFQSISTLFLLLAVPTTTTWATEKFNEIKILPGHTKKEHVTSPLPHTYVSSVALPDSFHWGNVNGVSYLTPSLNQHLPQYCGSCWAHGSISALADRIKIARGAKGDDVELSIQFILNCGGDIAGSCHGGYHTGVYEMIQTMGYVPYLTCMPYLGCSSESTEGICPFITEQVTCESQNICRTCDTFGGMGGKCTEIDFFPNATVAEYGMIDNDVDKIMTEIYTRGPVAATINAEPIVDYMGGIFSDTQYSQETNHIVSIVGWGTDETTGKKHWIVRNSWGQYWGELGFIRVEMGKNILGLEGEVAWATPGSWTEMNFPCAENGKNCNGGKHLQATFYMDPSNDVQAVQRRLEADNH